MLSCVCVEGCAAPRPGGDAPRVLERPPPAGGAHEGGAPLLGVLCFVSSFFFFSSRRRHTRCSRDWSSDVCSSDLAVPRRLSHVFTYAVPPGHPGPWIPGMRVRVPFGRSTLTGYIVAVTPHADVGGKPTRIREVLARVDEKPSIPPDLLALAQWVSEWYLAPLGQCLRLAMVDEKPSIPPDLLALAQWVSEWYLAPLGQCLRLAFHGAPEKPRSTTHTKQPDAIPSGPAPPVSDQSTYNVQRLTFNDMLAPLHTKVLDALAHHRQERIVLPAATHELGGLYSNAV